MQSFRSRSRRYGAIAAKVQQFSRIGVLTIACLAALVAAPAMAQERVPKIVAFGDSLTAGYGLAKEAAFPEKLAKALEAKGIKAEIVNAGVSGDTASAGLARLDWSVPEGTDAVILELGANDALRGVDPEVTRKALDGILDRLRQRKIAVLLCGMRAPPNMGPDYVKAFDGLFEPLAATYGALYYPFFLDGVAADGRLNQRDGIHPTAEGVDVIVMRIMPKIEELIARAKMPRE